MYFWVKVNKNERLILKIMQKGKLIPAAALQTFWPIEHHGSKSYIP